MKQPYSSKKKYLLEENKVKTLISNYTIVSNIVDKIKMFEFLERKKNRYRKMGINK